MEKAHVNADTIEKWNVFELTLNGPADGNPFLDAKVGGQFQYENRIVEPDGFYDGAGNYKIRFMPNEVGRWHYVTKSNVPELNGITGQFQCIDPSPENHGPVSVSNTYHFAYADGTPYFPVGTTCYAWAHQGRDLEEQTLRSLKDAPFNKIRMCVFPKRYVYNENEPVYYPFERDDNGQNDFSRFDPEFFRHLEQRIENLRDLCIEADIILFHPYDDWGYAQMEPEADACYVQYLVARLAAYRNVWWSMANEFDLMQAKNTEDWNKLFNIVTQADPYHRLLSIHNDERFYDHANAAITHVSVQSNELLRGRAWRTKYQKPVILDECCYEGNIPESWGNITARELVHRSWLATAGGCYAGHGETYLHPDDILWWSKGGVLRGESTKRIGFLKKILEEGPPEGINPVGYDSTWGPWAAGSNDNYYLVYFGVHQPAKWSLRFPREKSYRVDIIDTWDMTVTTVKGPLHGNSEFAMPEKPFMALRIRERRN